MKQVSRVLYPLTVYQIGARAGALAQPGEVLVSSTVRDLVVSSGLEFEDRREHTPRGVDGQRRARLLTRPPSCQRGISGGVGFAHTVTTEPWAQARAQLPYRRFRLATNRNSLKRKWAARDSNSGPAD